MNGINALMKETAGAVPAPHVRTQRGACVYELGRGSHQAPNLPAPPTRLGLPASRAVRNRCLLFLSSRSLVFSYILNGLRHCVHGSGTSGQPPPSSPDEGRRVGSLCSIFG